MENNISKQILHFMQMIYNNQEKLSQELETLKTTIVKSNEKIPFKKHNELNIEIYNKILNHQVILNDKFKNLSVKIEKPSINNYQKTNQYILFNKDFLRKHQLYVVFFFLFLMIAPSVYFYLQEQKTNKILTECSDAYYKLKRLYNNK